MANTKTAGEVDLTYGAGLFPDGGMFTAVLPIRAGVLSEAARTVLIEQCITAGILAPAGWIGVNGTFSQTRPRGAGFRPVFTAPGVTIIAPADNGQTTGAAAVPAAKPAAKLATRPRGRPRMTAKAGS